MNGGTRGARRPRADRRSVPGGAQRSTAAFETTPLAPRARAQRPCLRRSPRDAAALGRGAAAAQCRRAVPLPAARASCGPTTSCPTTGVPSGRRPAEDRLAPPVLEGAVTAALNRILKGAQVFSFLPARLSALWEPDGREAGISVLRFSRKSGERCLGETAAVPRLSARGAALHPRERGTRGADIVRFRSSHGHAYSAVHSEQRGAIRCLNFVLDQPQSASASSVERGRVPIEILFEDGRLLVGAEARGHAVGAIAGRAGRTIADASARAGHRGGAGPPPRSRRLGAIVLAKDAETRALPRGPLPRAQGDEDLLGARAGADARSPRASSASRSSTRGRTRASAPRASPRSRVGATRRRFVSTTEVEVDLETGRYNQIRLHFAHAGHPLVGERKYARGKDDPLRAKRVALHAERLAFPPTRLAGRRRRHGAAAQRPRAGVARRRLRTSFLSWSAGPCRAGRLDSLAVSIGRRPRLGLTQEAGAASTSLPHTHARAGGGRSLHTPTPGGRAAARGHTALRSSCTHHRAPPEHMDRWSRADLVGRCEGPAGDEGGLPGSARNEVDAGGVVLSLLSTRPSPRSTTVSLSTRR